MAVAMPQEQRNMRVVTESGRERRGVVRVRQTGDTMLHEFIAMHHESIVARTRDRVRSRPWPSVSRREIEYGVPLFLTQLSETLRLETSPVPFASDAIGSTAKRHGAELSDAGF